MGGNMPKDNSSSTNHEKEDDNPFEKQFSGTTQESSSTNKSQRFFGWFLEKKKIQPLFQPKTKTPEWNEVPQCHRSYTREK
jgi:hypothetical protein